MYFLQLTQKILVLRDINQARLWAELKHADWIVIGPIPELRIQVAENAASGGFPRPPQVKDHFPQWFEGKRQGRDNVIRLVSRHEA